MVKTVQDTQVDASHRVPGPRAAPGVASIARVVPGTPMLLTRFCAPLRQVSA